MSKTYIYTPAEPLPGHPAPEINAMIEWIISIRGGVQKRPFFLGDLSQMWVGRVADSQTRPNPLKITAKIAFFDPNFNLRFPKSRKNPWVGGVADSQTRSKPFKKPSNHPENRLFRPEFHLSFSQISQKPWGGWVGKQIWERFPKKNGFFFWQLP